MEDSQFQQMRWQLDRLIEQEKRHRRLFSFVLLGLHLVLVIGAAIYMLARGANANAGTWYPLQTEIVWMLWGILALSWFVHAATVGYMNRTVVANSVHESLMFLATHESDKALGTAQKRKRSETEFDSFGETLLDPDEGESRLTPLVRRPRQRNS